MWRWMTVLMIGGCVAVPGCGIEGVHNASPQTIIRVDPVSRQAYLFNSKDVNLKIDKIAYDKGEGFSIENLDLSDNASQVRLANVEQMQGMALQATANWQGASQMLGAMADVIKEIMPFLPQTVAASALGRLKSVGLSTPWGGATSGPDAAQIQALIALLEKQTTTRPAQ